MRWAGGWVAGKVGDQMGHGCPNAFSENIKHPVTFRIRLPKNPYGIVIWRDQAVRPYFSNTIRPSCGAEFLPIAICPMACSCPRSGMRRICPRRAFGLTHAIPTRVSGHMAQRPIQVVRRGWPANGIAYRVHIENEPRFRCRPTSADGGTGEMY